MLTDPSLDIQSAIVTALKPVLPDTLGARIYDSVPAPVAPATVVTFPYVTIGNGDVTPELGEATDAADTMIQVDAWSRAVGFGEVKTVARAIIAVLHDADLPVPNQRNVSILLHSVTYLRDPDGLTRHAALQFKIQTDAN
jgi:hypothetical protein